MEKRVNHIHTGALCASGCPELHLCLSPLSLYLHFTISHNTPSQCIYFAARVKRLRKKQGAREENFFIVYARGVGDGKLLIRRAGRVERADIFIANWITRLANAHRALAVVFRLCGTNTAKLHANYFLMRWILEVFLCSRCYRNKKPSLSSGCLKEKMNSHLLQSSNIQFFLFK